jgi:HEAT repeat protein
MSLCYVRRSARRLSFVVAGAAVAGCASQPVRQSVGYYEAGDYQKSRLSAEQGIADDSRDVDAWRMKLRALLALGHQSDLQREYTQYVSVMGRHDNDLLAELARTTLAQGLTAIDPLVKMAAIAGVEQAEIESLSGAVGDAMNDEDPRVAMTAAVAVINSFPFAAKLAQEGLSSSNPVARRIAVNGIGKKVGAEAMEDLVTASTDEDAGVRRAAVRWLGHFGRSDALRALLKRVADVDDGVRAAAARSVASIAQKLAAPQRDALALGNVARSLFAVDGLATKLGAVELARAAAQDGVLRSFATSPDCDPSVSVAAAIAMKAKDSVLINATWQRASVSDNPSTRAGAVNVADAALGLAAAKPVYIQMAKDAHPAVRLAVARAIYHLDMMNKSDEASRALANQTLLEVMNGFSPFDDRLAAATELALSHDQRGIDQLLAFASDSGRSGSEHAAAMYAHIEARVITSALLSGLADSSGQVRIEAARAIMQLTK